MYTTDREILFYSKLIDLYKELLDFCNAEIKKGENLFWWEEKKIHCEFKINEARRLIALQELKEELKLN